MRALYASTELYSLKKTLALQDRARIIGTAEARNFYGGQSVNTCNFTHLV